MRLESFKRTLTGKSEPRTVGEVYKPPPPPICSICKAKDEITVRDGQLDFAGNPIEEHLVNPLLRYIKKPEDVNEYFRQRGWKYRFHLGRHAMERMLCRPCMNETSILQRDFDRKKAADSARPVDSYYNDICEDQ